MGLANNIRGGGRNNTYIQSGLGFQCRSHNRLVLSLNCHLVCALESRIKVGHQPVRDGKTHSFIL